MLEGVGNNFAFVVGMIGDNHYLQAAVAVAIGFVLAWLAVQILGLFSRLARKSKPSSMTCCSPICDSPCRSAFLSPA